VAPSAMPPAARAALDSRRRREIVTGVHGARAAPWPRSLPG
jgi:hypothetical protein